MTRARELAGRAALVLASAIVGLVLLELGCRLAKGPRWLAHWPNPAVEAVSWTRSEQTSWTIHDPVLGYVPRPDSVTEYGTFDRHGFRLPSGAVPGTTPLVVAVGGSFTLGDEVADRDTWPVALRELTGARIVNAGVSGYALDQIVLRAERLAATFNPVALIVAFTPDNIWRNEMQILWGAKKPYFTLDDDGDLILQNVPVPSRPPSPTMLQHLLGWSALVEFVMERQSEHEEWMEWRDEWGNGSRRALPDGMGETIACALMHRLARLSQPVLVVAQYERSTWENGDDNWAEQWRQSREVLACATAAGLATLDTFGPIDLAITREGLPSLYLEDHHSASGNRLVARKIGESVTRLGLLQRSMTRTRRMP